jgi:pseudaminic acid biosynthesis-associated methylase
MQYKTKQEDFWAGEFGDIYTERNGGEHLITSNLVMFSKILKSTPEVRSIVELGCNSGLNLQALNKINENFDLCGYEINKIAANKAKELNIAEIVNCSILEKIDSNKKYDLAFTKGVLIHINPNELEKVYQNLYDISNKYILIAEYYNPTPVMVEYRGNKERLYKDDFAGNLISKFGLHLIDYGFTYHRDNYFPQDDITWFLLEK